MGLIKAMWQWRMVQSEQFAIAQELGSLKSAAGSDACLEHAMHQVAILENDVTPRGQIRRYIYVMSYIGFCVANLRFPAAKLHKTLDLARNILLANGVPSEDSKLSFLYGELDMAASEIHRIHGRAWPAAWQQQMATYKLRTSPSTSFGTQALAAAKAAMRLGHTDLAIINFERAAALQEGEQVHGPDRHEAWLGLAQAHRLAGRPHEAHRYLSELSQFQALGGEVSRDLVWEQRRLAVSQGENPEVMLKLIAHGAPHHQATYLLEASLWVKAMALDAYMDNVILVRTMARKPELHPQRLGTFYRLAVSFERCYERSIPLQVRLSQLGEALGDVGELATVDHELLIWAAATRFLHRSGASSLADLTLSEYVGLSSRLTAGQTQDVLGILSDIIDQSIVCKPAKKPLARVS